MDSKKKPVYSVVIPLKDEEKNIPILHKELFSVMDSLEESYEIIYVNDGSRDKTLEELKKLKNVKIINLNRNYGQAVALDAGFKLSKGEIVISIDGDLQNDPKDIPRLIKKLEETNLDVVAGWRKKRKDSLGFKILTNIGRFCRRIIISDPVHDTGCTLRVYKRKAVDSLDLYGEMHRYILALLRWKGFRIGELEVNHRPRINGKTKYGYSKAIRGFIDLTYMWFINKYSQRPLHMFGYLSLLTLFAGILSGFFSLYQKLFDGLGFNRNGWFFVSFFLILASIMFFSFGIIIDLLIKIHLTDHNQSTPKNEKRYYIRDVIDNCT
jgi:glycosyltransferase involved in cell wall biosynthesis